MLCNRATLYRVLPGSTTCTLGMVKFSNNRIPVLTWGGVETPLRSPLTSMASTWIKTSWGALARAKSVQKSAGRSGQPQGSFASPHVVGGKTQRGSQAALAGRPDFCALLRQSLTQAALRCHNTWTASKLSLRQCANSPATSGHVVSHASSHASGARISDLNPRGRSAQGLED